MKNRDKIIDVLKGIGIFSIVLGHSCWSIKIGGSVVLVGPFVYLYHLAIFVFCSGYLYKEDTDFYTFIIKKIKSLYIPFLEYSIMYLLLLRPLLQFCYNENFKFSIEELIIKFSNTITFNSMGELLSAFWFLPMLFWVMVFWAFICGSTKKIKNVFHRNIVSCMAVGFFATMGIYSTNHNLGLLCNLQISYLLMPIVFVGYIFRKNNLLRYISIPFGGVACLIMIFVLKLNIGIVELSKNMIINQWVFYPIILIGIYFCLTLAKIISRNEQLTRIVSTIGYYSFDIMALHFFFFKIIDVFVCILRHEQEKMNFFPRSYDSIWPAYLLLGICGPICTKYCGNKLVNRIRKSDIVKNSNGCHF